MEKLADNLQKMTEDDLLVIVQMIHDNKSADTWTKNDVDRTFQVLTSVWHGRLIILYRGRISGRPLHSPRQPDPSALGLHHR